MKISKTLNSIEKLKVTTPSFTGIKGSYDTEGSPVYKFTAPSYDSSKYRISLEVVKVGRENGVWEIKRGLGKSKDVIDEVNEIFSKGEAYEYTQEKSLDHKGHLESIGYRFKLTPIDAKGNDIEGAQVKYKNDPGTKVKITRTEEGKEGKKGKKKEIDESYSVVLKNTGAVSIGGPGYHGFADSLVYTAGKPKEGFKTRTHFNQAGATLADFTSLVQDKKLEPFRWIMTTPLIGQDNLSSHGYWPNNTYQISSRYGNLDDFKKFQVALFNEGKGHVNDGAFTSQVMNGFQMQNVLRFGEKSPFYHWFKLQGKPALGVLPNEVESDNPESKKALDNIHFRLVNSPNKDGFDQKKPTYIQFYDKRLTSDEQLNRTGELIKRYDNDVDDTYEIKEHEDSVQPYFFQLDRGGDAGKIAELENALKDNSHTPLSGMPNLDELLSFKNFNIVRKGKAGGANFWDGNVDLIKMNLSLPGFDIQDQIGMVQARNSMYGLGTYWTKTTSSAILEDLAKKAEHPKNLINVAKKFNIPEETTKEILENVNKGTYKTKLIDKNLTAQQFMAEEIVNFPLESIGFGADLSAILSSAYITPRPYELEHQNMSKTRFLDDNFVDEDGDFTGLSYREYIMSINKFSESNAAYEIDETLRVNYKTKSLYEEDMMTFVADTLERIQEVILIEEMGLEGYQELLNVGLTEEGEMEDFYSQKLIFKNNQLTDYGRYVARLLTPDIIKYGAVKGLFPGLQIEFDKDTHLPQYKGLENLGLTNLGIEYDNPKSEAETVISKLKKAFNPDENTREDMIGKLAQNFAYRVRGTNVKTFEKAEAILEQTGGGLNWRFDAAKDVADLDTRRSAAIYDVATYDKEGKYVHTGEPTEEELAQGYTKGKEEVFAGWKDHATFEKCWDDVIDIWKNFIGNVQQQNKSSYTIAEVTSIWDFYNDPAYNKHPLALEKGRWDKATEEAVEEYKEKDFGKYINPGIAERMLSEETGATTGSSYSNFFSDLPKLVGQTFEKGQVYGDPNTRIKNVLGDAIENYLNNTGMSSYVNNGHIFVDNHDKPRALHTMALDMNLYLTNFADFDNENYLRNFDKEHKIGKEKTKDYIETAQKVTGLNPYSDDPDEVKRFRDISAEAVAVGDVYMKAFEKETDKKFPEIKDVINQAIRDLALGKFKDQKHQDFRRAKAFGGKDFEISLKDVIEQAKYIAEKSNNEAAQRTLKKEGDYLAKSVRNEILKYPKEKFLQMWQLMQALPGAPTLYAGDEFGMTGHEDPSKNNKVNNREPLPYYKLKEKGYDEDVDFYNKMMEISSISRKPGMTAIGNGSVISMPQEKYEIKGTVNGEEKLKDSKLYALYHYDDKGSEVITVFANTGQEQTADPSKPLIEGADKENDPLGIRGAVKEVDSIEISEKAFPGGFDTKTKFKCKYFDGNKYVDGPEEYVVQPDGGSGYKLVKEGGGSIKLRPMTNFFYKVEGRKPFYHNGHSAA